MKKANYFPKNIKWLYIKDNCNWYKFPFYIDGNSNGEKNMFLSILKLYILLQEKY